MKIFALTLMLVTVSTLFGGQAAASIYVGSWQVDDGPLWTTNPQVYSGVETAAFLFGGVPADYEISINGTNPNTISNTTWMDGWGVHAGTVASNVFAENFSLDLGAPGYATPGGNGSAFSAYVLDGLRGPQFTNYAFLRDNGVIPEPTTFVVWSLLGAMGLCGLRRKNRC